MDSQVGAARMPSFRKELRFAVSGPFFLKWIAVGDVAVQELTYIRNEFLDNMPATFGKDCQEIEESAGEEMCRYLDRHMQPWRA